MKFYRPFLVILLCTSLLNSCGDSDSDNPFLGDWLTTFTSISNCANPDADETINFQQTPCLEGDEDGCTYQSLRFSENQITSMYIDVFGGSLFEDTSTLDYTLDGSTISICGFGDCTTYTYEVDNADQITLTGFDPDDNCNETWRIKRDQ